jgi:hypothetical protein
LNPAKLVFGFHGAINLHTKMGKIRRVNTNI